MKVFFTILLFCSSSLLVANHPSPVVLSSSTSLIRNHYYHYVDLSETQTAEEVRAHSNAFEKGSRTKTYLGYPEGAHWLIFNVINMVRTNEKWYLVLPFAAPESLEVYIYEKGKRIDYENLSQTVDIATRRIVGALPTLALPIPYEAEREVMIRLKDPIDINFEWRIVDDLSLYHTNMIWFGAVIAFLGVVVALSLYNLFIWLTLGDVSYLAYTLFSMSFCITVLVLSHFASIFMGFGYHWIQYRDGFLLISPITSIIFMRSFLHIKALDARLNRLTYVLMAILSGIMLARFSGFSIEYILDPIIAVTIVTLIFCGYRAAVSGFQPARIYLLAWGVFLGFVSIWLLGRAGLLPVTLFVTNMAQIGNAFEALLMSIALGERIKLLQVEKMAAQSKARDRSRYQQLVRVMCHDINNPLSIVMMQTNILVPLVPENCRKSLERLRRGADIIRDIISNISQSEAIRSGKKDPELVSLLDVYHGTKFMFEHQIEQKRISYINEIQDGCVVLADRLSFENEVINNIISNSIKFCSLDGTICFKAKSFGDKVRITITDDGIGMPAELVTHLFEERSRNSRSGTENERGTGFGMALVKSYVEDFGGTVSVVSSEIGPDKGTSITLELPSLSVKAQKTCPEPKAKDLSLI